MVISLRKIFNTGVTTEMAHPEKSAIRITNFGSFLVSLTSLFYFVYDLLLLPARETESQKFWFFALHLGSILIFFIVLFLNKKGLAFYAKILLIVSLTGINSMNSLALAQPFRTEMYLYVLAAATFVIFHNLKIIIPLFLLQGVAYLITAMQVIAAHPSIAATQSGLPIRIGLVFITLFFILFFLKRETLRYQEEIELKNYQLSIDRTNSEKLSFTKDKIFSILSHDLRSPIASLKAALSLLQKKQVSEGEFLKITTGLEKQVEQLGYSLDELLTWSKSQLKGINPMPEFILLQPVIEEIVAVHEASARSKKIILSSSVPSGLFVYCDPNMFKSVLTNLLTNALKFTKPGGLVTLTAEQLKETTVIRLKDTGVGIPSKNIIRILDPLDHFTTRGTNNEKGTGIGLVMCQEFIEKNNGKLTIESEPNKGTVIVIELPKKANAKAGAIPPA